MCPLTVNKTGGTEGALGARKAIDTPEFLALIKEKTSSLNKLLQNSRLKGQIMSKCIYETIDRKNLTDFCPGRFYGLGTCDLF